MKLKAKLYIGVLGTSLLFFVAFQNCSGGSFSSFTLDSNSLGKTLNSTRLLGNGEGYGGKLTTVYASVDNLNQCGKATSQAFPIYEQIEVKDGSALKTVENCQKLAQPVPVSLDALQAQSLDKSLFVLNKRIYQQGDWISTGSAPRDKYVDIFCNGKSSSSTDPNLEKQVELFMYNDLLNPAPSPSGSLSLDPNSYLNGILRTTNYNQQTNQVVEVQNQNISLQDPSSIEFISNLLRNTEQLVNDITTQAFNLAASQIQAALGGTSPSPAPTPTSAADLQKLGLQQCWRNQ